jgi:tRNA modification GTPase
VRQTIQVHGLPVNIIDTAGLRDTQDEVERIGIARTWSEIQRADVLLLLVDARAGVTAKDLRIVAQLPEGLQRLIVHNKVDLIEDHADFSVDGDEVHVSAMTGEGIEVLRDRLQAIAGWHANTEDVYLARERHLVALREAALCLERAALAVGQAELMAEELRLAQVALGSITGVFTADDLLGEIFSRFCIGK